MPNSIGQIARSHRTGPLSEEQRAAVMALAQERGATEAANILGIGKDTVARAAAGLAIRPSVAHVIAAKLLELADHGERFRPARMP
jgi:hypothetical protein